MPRRNRRRLSQQDLQAAGVTPGLMARRYDADGVRAAVTQLAAETPISRGPLGDALGGTRPRHSGECA